MRVASVVLVLICAVAPAQSPPAAQSASPDSAPGPTFEVATIKPSDPAKCCGRTFSAIGRHFATTNTNLKYLLQYAYNLQFREVAGGPAWMNEDKFNVAGEIEGVGAPTSQQWKEALQRLLVDRFQIQMHREIRELPAYALVIADPKKGPKLIKSSGVSDNPQRIGFSGAIGQTMTGGGTNATLKELAGELQRLTLDRPVVDQTGLTGTFNIQLTFTRDDPEAPVLGPPPPDDAAPTIFNALQEQLGLKLEPTKALVEVLVIDHADKPSED